MFWLHINTLRIFDPVWHENAIFRISEFSDFLNRLEDKTAVAGASGQELSVRWPEPNLLYPCWPDQWALTGLTCDNMMTTSKAVDFPALQK